MGIPGAGIIERAGLRAWPGIENQYDGTWVLRSANGYTKRANSVQSLDPADDSNVPARLKAARAWFAERGLPTVFRVTPLAGTRILQTLAEEGWTSVEHSHLMAMELGQTASDRRGEVLPIAGDEFIAIQRDLRGYDAATAEKLRALVRVMEVPAAGIVLRDAEGQPVSTALFAVADAVVITGNVITTGTERGKGYGKAMMSTGLHWARENGATVAALNVAADNQAGQGLYRSLGYAIQYDYSYRLPPSP